ncbi:Sugar-specific transcriptional regulator TrmB [Haladaptatus litoreus]|uniref:Sugar-specific transcriptional regulator TrmB n=1 Tax=Haladaptatus litoreus TaxID=553468 RepID=A0A1N7FDV3_9EURY|nr:helix-turn-helix domain-containing protein [Haladaptatus litoreus]SIR98539.1 Sugar-specific transcriptional regulator TrmB [Haladaptatus litoreus]
MNELSNQQQSIELLQQLGLKEYEARCFVALARLPKGTAKGISETSEVPRTRVYDAIRVLETKGLVEIQHSNPQQFRAVPIEEAAETLRQEYESRTDTLVEALAAIEPAESNGGDEEITHEVWALSGPTAITNRTQQLIDAAGQEIVFIIGRDEVVTEKLLEQLQEALNTGLTVLIGTQTEDIRERIAEAVPNAEVFVSGLEWLNSSPLEVDDNTTISRLVLIDKNTILVSSVHETDTGEIETEKAVFGRGFDNGIVVIARRLMATGLPRRQDPDMPDDE